MKNVFLILLAGLSVCACKTEIYQSPDGHLPDAYLTYARPYAGTYTADDGKKVVLSFNGNHPVLSTNFDVTDRNCGARIGAFKSLTVYPSDDNAFDPSAPFDAVFALDVGTCTWISVHSVTFHYNKAITGKDIYELTVILQSEQAEYRGTTPALEANWDLEKR